MTVLHVRAVFCIVCLGKSEKTKTKKKSNNESSNKRATGARRQSCSYRENNCSYVTDAGFAIRLAPHSTGRCANSVILFIYLFILMLRRIHRRLLLLLDVRRSERTQGCA